MKWIGQHIWDFVSRFRSDVYLDSPTAGGSDPDKFLGIDSNGKVIYRTGTQVLSDIGGSSSTGDIDRVSLSTDDSNYARVSSGNADFNLSGGACIDTTADNSVTATIAVDLSELSTSTDTSHIEEGFFAIVDGSNGQHKMAASTVPISAFNNDSGFAAGDITGVTLTADDSNVASDTAGSADFTIAGGAGIDTTVSGTTVTITGETASDSNAGIVELATTGEADTGTATGLAVTPAGLESHVSARYSYQYINFIGNSDIGTNWATSTQNGTNSHNWSIDTGESGTTVGTTTITVGRQYSVVGFTAPYACQLMGFWGTMRNHNNSNQGSLGLFVATGSDIWGATGTKAYTLRAMGSQSYAGGAGSSYTGGCKVDGILGSPFALAQGDIIIPAVLETTADKVYFQMTMVIKTLIPT